MSTEFFIGRYDLDFLDDFYPDDLPNEWQFDYYANMFNAVLLPLDTTEDIESILEELGEDFYLVFEVNEKCLQETQHLESALALTKSVSNVIFWLQVCQKPDASTIALFQDRAVVFQCDLPIKGLPKIYHHHHLVNKHIYYNQTPVLVSSLSLSDKEISDFLQSIAVVDQKIVLICRSAENANLEKAKLIAQMLGY